MVWIPSLWEFPCRYNSGRRWDLQVVTFNHEGFFFFKEWIKDLNKQGMLLTGTWVCWTLTSVLYVLACPVSIWDCRELSPASRIEQSLFQLFIVYPIGCFVITGEKGSKHQALSLRAMHIDGTVFYLCKFTCNGKKLCPYIFLSSWLSIGSSEVLISYFGVYIRFRTLDDSDMQINT